ncbi:BACON domain-containing protein [uncultured Porphyromonas sp.]|uniref:BACON domain-containing protein n=1 Tax=uncultured Porphyromonas sp. TaxID=159274 RepID=UPI00260A0C29|nr:BACON domain-containing protein [uncultured Porphyromonas sp.]
MRKRAKLWLRVAPIMLLLLQLTACKSSDNELDDEALQVSLTNVVFNKDGGQEVLSISGTKVWNYISNVGENDWLTPTKDNDKLTLTATANPLGKARSAEIIISSRAGVQKVYVTQSASDLLFSFSESELVFSHRASEKIVQIATNSDDWHFEPIEKEAKEWLSVVGGDGAKTLIIKVTANKEYESRATTLIAKAQNGEQTGLHITQKGVAKYLLPFEPSSRSHTDVELISFEQERGSILQGYQAGKYDNFQKEEVPTVMQFLTTSDYMPMIAYLRNLDELKYTVAQSILRINDDATQEELKEYEAFLKENGYVKNEKASEDLVLVYNNKDKAIDAKIEIKQGMAVVAFFPYYPQTKEYPTFPALPEGKDNWLDHLSNTQFKAEDIIRLEGEAGSKTTFVKKDDATQLYKTIGYECAKSDNQYDPINRTYWFYTKAPKNSTDEYIQTVSEQAMYFSNVSWGIREEGRRFIITNELEKLILDAGYQFDGKDKDSQAYFYWKSVSKTQDRVIYVQRVHFNDVNNDKPALMIGYFTIFNAPQATATAAREEQRAILAVKKGDFKALDYLHTSPRIRMYKALKSQSNRK